MPDSKYQPQNERHGKALCLSGGGFRATLFHAGALRRLNEVGVLSTLTTFSSVSGGSITNGLLAKVFPELRKDAKGVFTNFTDAFETPLRKFCSQDLRTGPLITERLDPRNWLTLLGHDHSATDFLSHTYRDHLVGDLRLRDLKVIADGGGPRFVFDTSNLQTGVNFEIAGDRIGDYQIGYADQPDFLVADAVAASSSFPIAFPPLVLKFDPGTFKDGRLEQQHPVPPSLDAIQRRVLLSDGGVYDNLGLEPAWKTHQYVFCSDGGKPFALSPDPGEAIVTRLLRCQDVIGNQALAVRKRWLVAALEQAQYKGAYWGIGTEIENYKTHDDHGYAGIVLDRLRAVRTDLDTFTEGEQLVLMNHGWMLADAALRTWAPELLPAAIPPGTYPSTEMLDPQKAVVALADSDKTKPFGH
jgi:NTE family protein